jgi:rubredoxin
MLYCQEEREVICPVCQTEVKEADCFDSTSISDLFYTTCKGCNYELNIEHGDDWQSVKPSILSYDFTSIPRDSQQPIFNLIATNENRICSDRYKTIYKGLNTFTNKYDLFLYDEITKQMSVYENQL